MNSAANELRTRRRVRRSNRLILAGAVGILTIYGILSIGFGFDALDAASTFGRDIFDTWTR